MNNYDNDKIKIMIVEDEVLISKQLQLVLEQNSFQIIGSATNFDEALKIIRENLPDLILMDINIKGGRDGVDTAIEIRKELDVPIIFLTAYTDDSTTERARLANPYGYISKPFKEKDLIIGIKMAVNKFRTEREVIQKLENENISLIKITEIDPLTAIPNRRRFETYAQSEWNRALRENKFLSILMIDVDYFKNYNDTYGHLAGDECLKNIAKCLSESLPRSGELVARYGGEEFIAILPSVSMQTAEYIAERFRSKVESLKIPHEKSTVSEFVTLSIGVASTVPSKEKSIKDLIELADNALYQSKSEGRNRITVSDKTSV